MNCPSCGTSIVADQQFCRSCGHSLLADKPMDGNRRAVLTLAVIFIGVVIGILGKKALASELITLIGVFIALAGMFFMAAMPYLRRSRPRKQKVSPSPQPDTLARADTTNKLLPVGEDDFIPSVTEGTTELLNTPARKQSVRRD